MRQQPSLINAGRNALRPGYLAVMAGKVLTRVERDESTEARRWAEGHLVSVDKLCAHRDPALWAETQAWHAEFESRAKTHLERVGVPLGGGGETRLLYFLVRLLRPDHVVETGVAAGFSTEGILAAMTANGKGVLHSSDFPYFRLRAPEEHIGTLVSDAHRERWRLHLQGDRRNLPAILRDAGPVGLFHYDSDKSRRGRRFALQAIRPALERRAVVVMDDIHNNLFFRDLVAGVDRPWAVTGSHRWPVGVLGLG